MPPCHKTANQVRPWPPQAASWHRASVSVGRTKNLLKTLQFKRICPTYACTKPKARGGQGHRVERVQPTQQRAQGRGESAHTALKRERERRVAVVWLGASERSGLAEPGWRAPTLARRRGAPRPTGRDATCAMRRDDPTRDRERRGPLRSSRPSRRHRPPATGRTAVAQLALSI